MRVHQRSRSVYAAAVDAQEPIWLGTKEAASHLGITARTLYRLIDAGDIPAYKLGRVLRIKRSDVEAFLRSVRVQPGDLEHLYPERKRTDAQPGTDT
jgi:putative molybdopterin biosynthesis protein